MLLYQASYRRIVGFPPLSDPRAIQQREQVVKAVYTQLTQTNITALALTGIGGAGKSTIAALVYRYTEEQRAMHTSPFLAETLWLIVDSTVTFADLIGNIFEALSKPIPQLSNLAPHNQAVTLFNALNTTDQPRLIILDQFENLLNCETGHARSTAPESVSGSISSIVSTVLAGFFSRAAHGLLEPVNTLRRASKIIL